MEKYTRIFLFVILYLTHLIQIWGEDNSSATSSSDVLAQVMNVRSRDDNKWMVAVKAAKSWDVKIKQSIPNNETLKDIFVHMYTRNSPTSFQEGLYESNLCDLLTDYSDSRFFPKDIVDMILPGHQGSCIIKKGKHQIQSTRCVSKDIGQNLGLFFPRSNPYELIVDFLSKTLPDDQRFFRVNLIVGNKTGCTYGQNNGEIQSKCSNILTVVRPICTTYHKVTSGIAAIGKSIKNLF